MIKPIHIILVLISLVIDTNSYERMRLRRECAISVFFHATSLNPVNDIINLSYGDRFGWLNRQADIGGCGIGLRRRGADFGIRL